jgi:hypothetical protein
VPRLVRYDGDTVPGLRPALAWHPVFAADTYRVEWANNARFQRSRIAFTVDTALVPPADLSATMWYWRVSTSHDYGVYSLVDSVVVMSGTGAAVQAGHPHMPPELRFRPDGALVAVWQARPGEQATVEILDVRGRVLASVCLPGEDGGAVVPARVCPASGAVIVRARLQDGAWTVRRLVLAQ